MKKFLKSLIISAVAAVMCVAIFAAGCTTAAVGISSIDKTSTDGNVDTYTITYTDGSTSTYTVTNGIDGNDGEDGEDGQNGKDGDSTAVGISSIDKTSTDGNVDTYTITYTDGSTTTYTVTNGVDGNDGEDGEDGQDGKDGENSTITVSDLYNYYKEVYGEIEYSEFLALYFSDALDASTSSGTSTSTGTSSVAVKNSCLLSAVSVYCEYSYTYSTGFGPNHSTGSGVTYSTGSGILYDKGDEYSYFLTNYHVVYEADYGGISDTIHLYLYGSETIPTATTNSSGYTTSYDYGSYAIECEYVGGSAVSDVAVIRAKTADIDAINSDFKAVTIADGYHVGETVFTIGNAEGEGLSMTEGIISVDSEYIYLSVDGSYRYHRSIRIDTALYSGNSGGGLFNENGELVGLVNAGSSTDENINYAIPLSIVIGTADNIIYYYEDGDSGTTGSYTITVGIGYTTENSKYVYDAESGYGEITEDIVVSSITSGSIAETLGLEVGDILTEMIITDNDGNTQTYQLTRSFNVTDLLLTLRAGYKISFTYTRSGESGASSVYTVTSSDLVARG